MMNRPTLALVFALLLLAGCRNSPSPPAPQGDPAAQARVTADGSGLFVVDATTLARLGWTAASPLALTLNGAPVAMQAQDDALYFYLPDTLPARYSRQQVLWLRHGAAATPSAVPTGDAPLTTVEAEQRLTGSEQYNPKYIGDPWFWRSLVAGKTESHEVATPGRLAGAVTVEVRAAGTTATDHELIVSVGDQEVGTLSWHGEERKDDSFAVDLPAGEALTLSFAVPRREGPFDISVLDEVRVRYPSQPQATEGVFRGRVAEGGTAQFAGLSAAALAWQLEPTVAPLPVSAGEGGAQVALPAAQPVIVVERDQAQPVTAEAVDETAIPTEGAAYVAIVAPELRDALQPLLDFHQGTGLSVLALEPQQIYDAYTHGTTDPLAFRALLQAAQEGWAEKPRWVLLVGDSTYDPAGNQNPLPPTYVPSPFIETVFGGETVSDNMIADVDEDGYPDVALGRLPARTPEQLATMIEKIVAYSESPSEGDWRQRVLLAADGQEALFEQNSESLRELVPPTVEATSVYPAAESDAIAQMLPALNEGNLIVNYVGHGSVQQWGRDQLLTAEAASQLSNGGQLPIFIHMTCLTGLFSHPSQESLAEALLWSETGGAIAAVAPSSLTLPGNQTHLNRALLEALFSDERPTVGEALMEAKRQVSLGTNNDHDIVATFNLLGDPAVRLALP